MDMLMEGFLPVGNSEYLAQINHLELDTAIFSL